MPEPVPAGFPFMQGLLMQSMLQTQTTQLQNTHDILEKPHKSLQVPKSILATNFNPALVSIFFTGSHGPSWIDFISFCKTEKPLQICLAHSDLFRICFHSDTASWKRLWLQQQVIGCLWIFVGERLRRYFFQPFLHCLVLRRSTLIGLSPLHQRL